LETVEGGARRPAAPRPIRSSARRSVLAVVNHAFPAEPVAVPPYPLELSFASPSMPDYFWLMVGLYFAGCGGAAGFAFWMTSRLDGAVSWVFGGMLLGVLGISAYNCALIPVGAALGALAGLLANVVVWALNR